MPQNGSWLLLSSYMKPHLLFCALLVVGRRGLVPLADMVAEVRGEYDVTSTAAASEGCLKFRPIHPILYRFRCSLPSAALPCVLHALQCPSLPVTEACGFAFNVGRHNSYRVDGMSLPYESLPIHFSPMDAMHKRTMRSTGSRVSTWQTATRRRRICRLSGLS
jgi:hypothetical protein